MRKWLENQFIDMVMYVPFIMAFGAGLYFTLPDEPRTAFVIITIVVLVIARILLRRTIILRAGMIFLFGFCYAMAYTHLLNTPILPHTVRDTTINASVINIDYATDRPKILLRTSNTEIGINKFGTTNVRVSAIQNLSLPNVGDKIIAHTSLFRPTPAYAPDTFDYARWAYFHKISATGYITDYSVVQHTNTTDINSMREYLHNKTNSVLADGLVLGYKNALSDTDKIIWTTAGVGHIWAISGFHMALVGGWLFIMFLGFFRLISPISKRVPAPHMAMASASVGMLGYMMISGASVSTIRAFLLSLFVAIAFIIGRTALSLRNLCLVFCVIFLINPYYVMQAGFQLSFAAVFGLIWFWREINPRMPHNKITRTICIAILTTSIATLFTAPFIMAHFNTLPLYGLLGNLIILPIFSVAIMPLVLIGVICACFGWHWPLDIAQPIYNFTFRIAKHVADIPGANVTIPYIPNAALIIITIGLLCLVLLRPVRSYVQYSIFSVCTILFSVIVFTYPRPVFMTTSDNELVAFADNGSIKFNKTRASNHFFAFSTWKQMCNISPNTPNIRYKHDKGVYTFNTPRFNLVYIQKFVPLQKNISQLCEDNNIDYIVSYFRINSQKCNHKILRGGFVIYPSGHIKYIPTKRWWHIQH